MLEYRYGFSVGQFRLSETSYMQTDTDWMRLNCLYVYLVGPPLLSQEPWKGRSDWTRAGKCLWHPSDVKCDGKELSVSDKLIRCYRCY